MSTMAKAFTWDDKPPSWYRKKERYHYKLWQYVHEMIALRSIQSVLEIGGGPGRLSTSMKRYVGVDLSEPAINAGRKKYPHADFVHGDWLEVSIVPYMRRIDMVLALAVIEHCEDHDRFLRKIMRVRPRLAIVSYFLDLTHAVAYRHDRSDQQGVGFVECRQTQEHVEGLLDKWGLEGHYRTHHIRFGRRHNLVEAVLTIEPTEEWRNRQWTLREASSTC